MDTIILVLLLSTQLCVVSGCQGQSKPESMPEKVGGAFENSEYTYYGIPKVVSSTDTSAGWNQQGPKMLLTGTVYQSDGKTPAPDVLLYYYHTNTEGRYLHKPDEERSMPPNSLGQTHGYIRGWVKTDRQGRYFIYTVRPGTYPTRDEPAHVHVTVKEPNALNEYYIDDFVFDDDELLTSAKRKKLENRGGSGVLRLVRVDGMMVGERNLFLGLNIPGYPIKETGAIESGNSVGEDVVSFIPHHAWGPDKGTRACPICKYGWYHGILYCVGNHPDWAEIRQWLTFLEAESRKRAKYLKVYFVYGNETQYQKNSRENELAQLGRELGLENVALTFVPSFTDRESEIDLNRINPDATNTFLVYRRSRIIGKFIDLKPTQQNFALILRQLDQTTNEYFALPKPEYK